MNTLFEILVSSDDPENDAAAAEAALDEIVRVETILSRFDRASEVARVNREAHRQAILISRELFEIITNCRSAWETTAGFFDITTQAGVPRKNSAFNAIKIDPGTQRISFADARVRLDFGAFGKGYALDRAAEILKENGVPNAVLHGGTSSVLAMGETVSVGVRNPWNQMEELQQVVLGNCGLSTSATFHGGLEESDIVNPHEGERLREDSACVVIAATAAEAEVFSTALLCMGKNRATQFCTGKLSRGFQVFWIDKALGEPRVEKLTNIL